MVDRRSGHGRPDKPASGHGVASLVGGGPSIVGPVGAMRTRDVSRPRAADYARAEKTVVLRRRPVEPPPAEPPPAGVLPAAAETPDLQSSAGESDPAVS